MTAPPFSIAVAGPFRPDQFVSEMTDERRPAIPEVDALIAEAWEERLTLAATRGQQLWAGPMCRLVSWRAEAGALHLRFGPTDYRELVGTNVANPHLAERYGAQALSNGCGVCGIVRTADGLLILQHRSGAVFESPGLVGPCGGQIEPIETSNGPRVDPVATIRRELEEELGIDAEGIEVITCLGLGHATATCKPEIVFLITTSLTWDELRDRRHEEHHELVALADTPETVARSLKVEWERYAPPGLLALTLREVTRFGEGLAAAWGVG